MLFLGEGVRRALEFHSNIMGFADLHNFHHLIPKLENIQKTQTGEHINSKGDLSKSDRSHLGFDFYNEMGN